ncbi:MAG TPA: hypothetical protein VGJ54_07615, partial [Streptosporangiaceae bacterium]
PEAGAQCGNSARWDLCGGPPARAVPTATGRYYRTALDGLLRRINAYLMRWAQRKYKRLRSFKKARRWWQGLTARQPGMLAHWAWMNEF